MGAGHPLPQRVAIGDLDGDGKPDLATSDYGSNAITVFQNTSTSGTIDANSLTAKATLTTATNPYGLVIGDMDGDGKPDLATANQGSDLLSVFHNLTPTDPAPTITSISPTSGKPGDSVTIIGTNFDTTPANNTVFFDPVGATVTAATTTQLTVIIPDGAGFGPISVTVSNRTAISLQFFLPTYSGIAQTVSGGTLAAKVDFTGSNPRSVGVGDIDGDGKPDIVVSNSGFNTISVFRSTSSVGGVNGSSLAAKVDFATGANPSGLDMGDLDGDGKPDIVVTNNGAATISVFHNTSTSGSVSFAAKVDLSTGTAPFRLAIGDIDGDGKPDIAVTNNSANTVSVLRNTSVSGSISASSFAAKVDFTTAATPADIAVVDVDGNSAPDLVVTTTGANSISVLRNTASPGTVDSGSFAAKVDFSTGTSPDDMRIGDVDGDGKPDVIAANAGATTMSILRNTSTSGTVSFAGKVDFSTTNAPVGLGTGDVDGDGKPDIAVSNGTTNQVLVFHNTSTSGSVTLAAAVGFSTGTGPRDIAVVDMDGDGKPDISVANLTTNNISVFHNIADPPSITSFTPTSGKPGDSITITGTNFDTTPANNTVFFDPIEATVTAATTTQLTVTIPNGAGYGPVSVTTNSRTTISDEFFLPTYDGIAQTISAGTMAGSVDFSTGTTPVKVVVGDIDGDGLLDVVASNNGANTVSVYRNTTTTGGINSGSLAAKVDFTTGAGPNGAELADLDGDGKLEMIVPNDSGGTVSVFHNTATSGVINASTFAAKVDFTVGAQPRVVRVGDIDGDGKPDLATPNGSGTTVSILRNTSTSGTIDANSFAANVTYTAGSNPNDLRLADIDGDGKPDVVSSDFTDNVVSIYRNTSTAGTIDASSLASRVNYTTGTNPNYLAIADIDGDGQLDVASANANGNTISLLRNTATSGTIDASSLAAKFDLTDGDGPAILTVADLDGDGKPDLVAADFNAATVSVFENTATPGAINGSSFATRVTFGIVNSNPTGVAAGDLDGDGRPEIIASVQSTNELSVLHNIADPPTLTSFTPTSGNVGTTVTITGTAFDPTPANNTVFFGATKATVSAATPTQLTVTVPAGASFGPIRVTVSNRLAVSVDLFMPTFTATISSVDGATLAAKVSLTTGTTPYRVAVGDVDGDGKPDLASTNFGANTVSLFRNTSTSGTIDGSSYASKVDFTTGTAPLSVEMGDLDGDGKLDLVVTNYTANTLSVFRNTSVSGTIDAGTLAAKVDFTTGTEPRDVSIADFDLDGKLDLVITDYNGNTVSVYRNTSVPGTLDASSFAARVSYVTPANPHETVVADLDGDGKLDMATPNFSANSISVFRNTSTPGTIAASSFAAKVDYTTATNPIGLAAVDVDGDGKLEMVATNFGSNSLSLFRNTSTPGTIDGSSFAAKVDFTTGASPRLVDAGDVNGDGKPDIAVLNQTPNTVSIFRNTAVSGTIDASSLDTKVDFTTDTSPFDVAVDDLDGDGKSDVVVVANGADKLSLLHNLTFTGSLPTITSISPTSGKPGDSVIITGTNFDATPANNTVFFDPIKATVTAATTTQLTVTIPDGAGYGPVSVTTNNRTAQSTEFFLPTYDGVAQTIAAGTLAAPVDFATGTTPIASAIGDVDGDGDPDLVVTNHNSNTVSVYRNLGLTGGMNAGSFAAPVDLTTANGPRGVALGDIDRDGKLDLAVVCNNGVNTLSLLHNTSTTGSVSFLSKVDFTTATLPNRVAIGDLDGDGKLDVAVTNTSSNSVSVFRNTSISGTIDGNTLAVKVDFTTGTMPLGVAIGDIDGDDKPDVVAINQSANTASVLRNTSNPGTVSLAGKVDFATGTGPHSAALVDLDEDGKLDLVSSQYNAGSGTTLSTLRNTSVSGTVSFAAKIDFTTATAPRTIATGDVDGDGRPDLAVSNLTSGTVSVLRNTGTPGTIALAAKVDLTAGTSPRGASIGDLDGDGRPEVVAVNSGDDDISVFHNIADPPTITAISSNPAKVGESVTIAGTSFSLTPASNVVRFGGSKAIVASASATSLSVTIPAGATTAPVSVTVGGRTAYSAKIFQPTFAGTGNDITATTFKPAVTFATGTAPQRMARGDLDGDGKLDLIVANKNAATVSILRNTGAPGTIDASSFAAKVDFTTGSNPLAVTLGDLDGDGKLDLAISNNLSTSVSILRNTSTSGSISMAAKVDFTTGTNPTGVVIDDVDRDGKPDVVIPNLASNTLSILRNISVPGTIDANSFATKVDFATGTSPQTASIGDVDGDGKPELAVVNFGSNTLSLYRNTATAGTVDASSFATKVDFTTGSIPTDVAITDLDGDAKPDLAVVNFTSNTLSVFRNTSTSGTIAASTLAAKVDYATGTGVITGATGDVQGDGKPEIVVTNKTDGTITVYTNRTASIDASSFADSTNLTVGTTPISSTFADVDGDGRPDLIVSNQDDNTLSVFRNIAKLAIEAVIIDSVFADPQGVLVRLVEPDSGVTVGIGSPITVSVIAFPAVTVDTVLIGLSSDAQVLNFGNLGHLDTLTAPTASTTLADTFRAVFTIAPGDTQMTAPTAIAIARVRVAGDSLGFKQLDNQSTFEIITGLPEFGLVGDQKTFGIDGKRPLATAIDSALIDTAALTNTGGTIFGARATTDGADGANQLIRSFKIGDEVTVKLNVDNGNFLFTQLDSVLLYVVDAITPGYQVPDSAFVSVAFSALEVFLQNGNVTHTFTVVDSLFQTAQIDDNVRVQVLAHFRDKAGNLSAATTDAATAAAFSMDILTVADTRSPIVSPIHPTTAGDAFTGRIDTTLTFRQDNGTTDNALSFELNPLTLTVDEGTSAILVAVDTDTASFSGADDGDTLQLATVDSFAAPIGEAAGATIDLTLVGIDSVGNRTPVLLGGVVLDQVAPNATNVFPTVAALDTNVINSQTRHPRFTVDEPLDSVAVRFIEDVAITPTLVVQSLNAAELADFGENVMITVTTSLEDGTTYTLQILTKDLAGNVSVTSIETLTYDASFTNPEADSFIVTLDSSATVIDSVIAGVNLPIKIIAIDTALSNADERLRPAVTFTGENVTVHVDAGDQDTSTVSYAGTGVIDNGDGTTTLSNDDWVIGSRILKVKSEKALDDFSLVVTSKDSAYSGRLDSLTVDAAELSTYSIVALEDGLIADAVAGDFDLHVAPADAFGNPSTKVFVTTAADLTDADSLVASSNLLGSRIPGSNVLGSIWVEFAANVGDVGLPDGSHKVLPEGTSFILTAPHRTGSDLIVSVRTTNAPGDTTGVTLPHTIALGRSVPLAFFAEGETPAIVLLPAAPDTFFVTDYRGANNEGDQGGFVIVTFPPSKDGDARDPRVNHYRVYREIAVTVGVNDFGEIVETGDTTLAFVSWAVIDSPPEDTLIIAVVPAIDNVETRWGVAGEYGATSGEAGPLAKSAISPTDDVNGDDIQTLLQGFGISIAQPITVEANGGSPATDNRDVDDAPPSSQPTPVDKNAIATAQFDPQPPRITSAKLSSTSMTLSEPARAIDNIPPAPVTNVRITQDGEATTVTWNLSPDDRPVGSIPYRGFAIPIPGVARYRILAGDSATGLESRGTVSAGTISYHGVLEGSLIRVDAEDLDNITEGPVIPLGVTSFVDADGNPVYILIFDGNTPLQQDFEDFIEFARSFAASEGDENYNILADVDRDGQIGFADFLTFVQAFNRIAVDPAGMGPAAKRVIPEALLSGSE